MERIELSQENVGRRIVIVLILVLVAGAAFAYGVSQLFSAQTGWQAIEGAANQGPTCAGELVFLYELGVDGSTSAAAEGRAVTELYSGACRTLYQLFHPSEEFEGVANLCSFTRHPNETLTVDPMLYRALEVIQHSGDRTIYLGPVYERYGGVFLCQEDGQLVEFDPRLSQDVAREYETLAAYARSPEAIDLNLLGDNQVRLSVSEEYLAYVRREDVNQLLDFGWLKNAFVVDALAELMLEHGFTHGTISSYDGFQRNLDSRGTGYSQNVLDCAGGVLYRAAVLEYQGPRSFACLRDYSADSLDWQRIYRLENGETRTVYLSPEDGLCRSAVHDLTAYSEELGCGELALRLAPVYVADALDAGALDRLAQEGIQSIHCRDRVIYATEPGASLTNLHEGDGVRYTLAQD